MVKMNWYYSSCNSVSFESFLTYTKVFNPLLDMNFEFVTLQSECRIFIQPIHFHICIETLNAQTQTPPNYKSFSYHYMVSELQGLYSKT